MANLFHTSLFDDSKVSGNEYISWLNADTFRKQLEKEHVDKQKLQAIHTTMNRSLETYCTEYLCLQKETAGQEVDLKPEVIQKEGAPCCSEAE